MAGRKRMPNVRIIAAAALAAVFAFAQGPASAASCEGGDAACTPKQTAQQDAPMKLDNFMKTWQPASTTRSAKRSKKTRRQAREVAKQSTPKPATPTTEETTPAPAIAAASQTPTPAAAATQPNETDGVAVTSFN